MPRFEVRGPNFPRGWLSAIFPADRGVISLQGSAMLPRMSLPAVRGQLSLVGTNATLIATSSGGAWASFTGPVFVQGAASTWSFASYAPSGHDFFFLAPGSAALPSGVTLDSTAKQLVYDGVGAVATVGTVIIRSMSMATEWSAQSQGAGVFLRNDFSYRNAAETLPITTSAELRESAWGTNFDGDSTLTVLESAIKLTGNSCRFNFLSGSAGAYSAYRQGFDGVGASTKNVVKNRFYYRWSQYLDAGYRDFFFGTRGVWGGKMVIFEAPDATNDYGEVVVRRAENPGGYFLLYHLGATYFYSGLNWPGLGGQRTEMNFINRGAPTVTNTNTLQQRYGLDYASRTLTSDSDPDIQHTPRMPANAWYTFEIYIDQISKVIKLWGAPYGQPPELVAGWMNAALPNVGAMDGSGLNPAQLYTGCQHNTFPNPPVPNWPSSNTFWLLGQIIASDNPIPFPGQYTLPFSGTTVPTGYPPSGAVENLQ